MNSLSLFSLLFTLLILNSCRTELKNSEPKFDLDKIKLKGKITVLMDNSTLSFYDDKGKESGFEYEILAAFAKSIGLKLEVKVINNQAEFFQRLNSGARCRLVGMLGGQIGRIVVSLRCPKELRRLLQLL